MKPKAALGKIEQVKDGQTFYHKIRKNGSAVLFTICCDCSLTHLEEYKPTKGYVRIRVWRDEERTQKLRKRRKRSALH